MKLLQFEVWQDHLTLLRHSCWARVFSFRVFHWVLGNILCSFLFIDSTLYCVAVFLRCMVCLNNNGVFISFELPGLQTLDPPLGPPSTWAQIFRCTFLTSFLLKALTFQAILSMFFNKKHKKRPQSGHVGSPNLCNILWIRSICNISEPYDKAF